MRWRNSFRAAINSTLKYQDCDVYKTINEGNSNINRIAYKVLIGKPDGKRPLGRPRRRWEDNIRMDLNEMGYEGHKWRDLTQGREQWRDLRQ